MQGNCAVSYLRLCFGFRRKVRTQTFTNWRRMLAALFVAGVLLLYIYGALRQWVLICQGKHGRSVRFKWQIQRGISVRRSKQLTTSGVRDNSVKNIKLLCWVMTSPSTLRKKAAAVRDTWAQLCDMALFMSSQEDLDFPAIGLKVPENYASLWLKAREAWLHVYEKYLDQFDWFLKADDDTYVLVDNLRRFLVQYDAVHSHYFGHRMHEHANGRWWCEDDYNSGGAGYIVSRKALHEVGPILQDSSLCSGYHSGEDVQFSLCLKAAGVEHPEDTRDNELRQRFHLFSFRQHMLSLLPQWAHQRVFDSKPMGDNCCSRESVSFHYVSPEQMWRLHYLLHCIQPGHDSFTRRNETAIFCKTHGFMDKQPQETDLPPQGAFDVHT